MGRNLHPGRGQGGQRRLEILNRAVEVVDLADRLIRADHIHHRGIDARSLHPPRAGLVGQGGVDGDLQIREVALQPLDHRIEPLIPDLIAPVRSARQQKALQTLRADQVTHLAIQILGTAVAGIIGSRILA